MNYQDDLICPNLSVNEQNHLCLAGQDVVELAKTFGTPLYLMDEARIRDRARTYRTAAERAFGTGCRILYASKAASFKRLYEIMREEGIGVDVVSCGEIATACRAGYPMGNAFFHSNNKTDADVAYAMDHGVGFFVADNPEELYAIDAEAGQRGIKQKVLLRLTPGIDPHTYEAVATGKVDSKFGFATQTGQADAAVTLALSLPHIALVGYHCHIGSQVFDATVYLQTLEVMLHYTADVKKGFGYEPELLDIGGGFGVRYTSRDPFVDIAANIASIGLRLDELCAELRLTKPKICMEPGRSMVADAGMTLYTVGSVKDIPGYRTYVSVDGGMTDNPRVALYGASYTILPADKMAEDRTLTVTVAGRCCESGDILQRNVLLPQTVRRGDLLACLTTGAYHYSMANNYNRIPRPPILMVGNGATYLAVRRETVEDLVALDI